MSPDSPDLVTATTRLSQRVEKLTESIEIQDAQARRTKRLLQAAITVLVLAVLGVFATGYASIQAHEAITTNRHSQVVTCQNANDARAANQTLWTFLIGQSKAETTAEKIALQKLLAYITRLYSAHDCSQLDKKYPLPPAPELGLN